MISGDAAFVFQLNRLILAELLLPPRLLALLARPRPLVVAVRGRLCRRRRGRGPGPQAVYGARPAPGRRRRGCALLGIQRLIVVARSARHDARRLVDLLVGKLRLAAKG